LLLTGLTNHSTIGSSRTFAKGTSNLSLATPKTISTGLNLSEGTRAC
jgi:hypothetical protein